MAQNLDLLKIAQEEQNGDLFKMLDGIYKRSAIKPTDCPDAIIWEGGSTAGGIKPVAHAFTDMFALNGTLMALDVLGLPFLGVPMMAQFRHDSKLASLEWFGKLDYTALKWSTAGDFMVNEGGKKVVVNGKSANAPLRTAAGVYCNVRPYGGITSIRFMPGLPYSQDKKKFKVDPATGVIHSEMNTPGVRMAYAARLFLKMVHETGQIGRVATKPTQAQEDAINAGIMRWLLQGTKFKLKRQYTVDAYEEHRANVDAIVACLPKDFKDGMENWGGGDRLTDLMADAPDVLRDWGQIVIDRVGAKVDMKKLWVDMGFTMTNGKDMTSVMYRVHGAPIYEQTLGSADAMLLRLLDGDETVGGEKQPYDPRIHFVLINEAYKAANPGNKQLSDWLDAQLATFDKIFGEKRPRYLDGYAQLKAAIKPWGTA